MAEPGKTLTIPQAVEVLRHSDPVLDSLAARHGLPRLRSPSRRGTRFEALVTSIVFQQLAGRAASAIHARLVTVLGGEVTPERILAAGIESLMGAGLSRAKATSITDLADKVHHGDVRLDRIGRLRDDDIVDHLIQVRGIGRWTAEMFLLFTLNRLDVWPVGDFGVRVGYATAWALPETPTPMELTDFGERFRPYRSLVAWYCWRAADDRKRQPVDAAPDQISMTGR